ncbi:hypothetical protein AV530_000211 [Patagioenas fasciata monilis]|uniref:Protein kinase domain-containing protein n=1 Tax=Patagioenas fasciata monilis TaxID=372326 RepID=A0A1V4KDT3_PATFA|nr:hypothetical protein AV530_000211 [Patagioenas fasciata monilis]
MSGVQGIPPTWGAAGRLGSPLRHPQPICRRSGHFSVVKRCWERSTGTFYTAELVKTQRRRSSRRRPERAQVERGSPSSTGSTTPTSCGSTTSLPAQPRWCLSWSCEWGSRGGGTPFCGVRGAGRAGPVLAPLFDFIVGKETLSEEEAIEFLGQILRGVRYLHSHHITHLDLKVSLGTPRPRSLGDKGLHPSLGISGHILPSSLGCLWVLLPSLGQCPTSPRCAPRHPMVPALSPQPENIMLQDKDVPKPQIKIIDLGLAQHLEDGVTSKSLCGTPQYISTGRGVPGGVLEQRCSVGT